MKSNKTNTISDSWSQIQRIKGTEVIFYRPASVEATFYYVMIFNKRNSLNDHNNVKFPGMISKRAYTKLNDKERRDYETFKKHFGSCQYTLAKNME